MAVTRQGRQDLTQGALGKRIVLFSIPLILSNLLQVLFNMADVAVVGRFGGPGALGSVGSTTILVSLFTGLLIGLSSGVNVLTALHFGAKARRELAETVHASALICALAGALLLAVGAVFARPILELLRTKDELIDGAVLYLRIYVLGMPALGVYNFGNAVFSAIGDTQRPLRYLSAAGVLNIVLNLFFVIACGLGVAGVALASILSQYLSAVLILAALFRRGDELYGLRRGELRLYRRRSRAILSIGVPSALQHGIFALANLFIQAGVNSFSAVMVEGNAAAANADSLVYDVMAAFYTACSSFIGQNYGAGKWDRIWKSYLISLGCSFGISLAMGLGLFACGPLFLALFTTEEAVVEAGMRRLAIMSVSYCVSAFMDCTIAASRGLGRSLGPMVIVVLGSCVFRILWVYTVFAYFHTIASLYLLYVFSWGITAAAEIVYFRRTYRRLRREHLADGS